MVRVRISPGHHSSASTTPSAIGHTVHSPSTTSPSPVHQGTASPPEKFVTVAPSGVQVSTASGVRASTGTAASRGRARQCGAPVTAVRTAISSSSVTATFGCSRARPSSTAISTPRHSSTAPASAPGIIAIPTRFGRGERWIHSFIGAAGTIAAPSAAAIPAQRRCGQSTWASAPVPSTHGTTARARAVPLRIAGIDPHGIREARSWKAAG